MVENKKVLVIEDEEPLRLLLVSQLQAEGFTSIGAQDGEEGLTKALVEKPDLILVDLVMPKMDGISMLRELRKDKWGKKVGVIVLTNLSDSEKMMELADEGLIENGEGEYLIKSNWQLQDVIEKVKDRL